MQNKTLSPLSRTVRRFLPFCIVFQLLSFAALADQPPSADAFVPEETSDPSTADKAFSARATAYYPSGSEMEGGYRDREGKPLHTLQAYLDGKAPYVSVAMDPRAFAYGTELTIPELDHAFGAHIPFRVVDTGGAFEHKGTSRIDICVENRAHSLDPRINRGVTLVPGADVTTEE